MLHGPACAGSPAPQAHRCCAANHSVFVLGCWHATCGKCLCIAGDLLVRGACKTCASQESRLSFPVRFFAVPRLSGHLHEHYAKPRPCGSGATRPATVCTRHLEFWNGCGAVGASCVKHHLGLRDHLAAWNSNTRERQRRKFWRQVCNAVNPVALAASPSRLSGNATHLQGIQHQEVCTPVERLPCTQSVGQTCQIVQIRRSTNAALICLAEAHAVFAKSMRHCLPVVMLHVRVFPQHGQMGCRYWRKYNKEQTICMW